MTYCRWCRTNYGSRQAYSLHRPDGKCLDRAALAVTGRFDLSAPVVRLLPSAGLNDVHII